MPSNDTYQNNDLGPDDLLSTQSITDLMAVEVGECVWVPVTLVRGENFRAVKVEVKERASAGKFEEENAIESWDEDVERLYGNSSINTVECETTDTSSTEMEQSNGGS